MSRTVIIGGVIVLAVVVTGSFWLSSSKVLRTEQETESLSPGTNEASEDKEVKNKALPEFTLTDFDGTQVTSADLVGKPLVVNAWASWWAVQLLYGLGVSPQWLGRLYRAVR